MPTLNRVTRERLKLFGIFILLGICVLLIGYEVPKLPPVKQLEHFKGQVTYVYEGFQKGAMWGHQNFLIFSINNNKHYFKLGYSDYS